MKNLNLIVIVVLIGFVYTSCSLNETTRQDKHSLDLLEVNIIKRDPSKEAIFFDFYLNEDVNSSKAIFSRVLEEEYNKPLKFDFVYQIKDIKPQRTGLATSIIKKPIFIIETKL